MGSCSLGDRQWIDKMIFQRIKFVAENIVLKQILYEGRFYVRREVDLMKTAKVNANVMHIFGKIELLSIHAI